MASSGWIVGGLGLVALAVLSRSSGAGASTSQGTAVLPGGWTAADLRAHAASAGRLGMAPADLLLVEWSESGGLPWAAYRRKSDGYPIAVGLNQLTAQTNAVTGLTEAERVALVHAPVSAQIPIVERSLRGRGVDRYPSAAAIYAMNAAPSRAATSGFSADTVLYTRDGDPESYEGNAGLDRNHDGVITIGDLGARLQAVADRSDFRAARAALEAATGKTQPLTIV